MPNHVRNTIHFDCSDERLREILTAIQCDNDGEHAQYGIGTVDFNKIIPMPPSLNITAGSTTDRGLKAYRDFIDVYTLFSTANMDRLNNIPTESEEIFLRQRTDIKRDEWNLGKNAWSNIRQFGAPTWYDWSINRWGTKWSAYDFVEQCEKTAIDEHSISFSTAWSAPHPILEKLSEMFPDIAIEHAWADEDIGNNCGYYYYSGGERLGEDIFENDARAIEFACKMWNCEPSEIGYALSSDGSKYLYTENEEYELIEVCGQPALFTNERLTGSDVPDGLFHYDLRESDSGDGFAAIEPYVKVNHGGSIITNQPIDFGKQRYIAFTDETSPNFLGNTLSLRQYMEGDFEQEGGINFE